MRPKFIFAAIVSCLFVACSISAQEQIGGIGAWFVIKNHTLVIANVLPNTPASKAGLIPGLLVKKIDGVVTAGKSVEDCAKMIRGVIGTTVRLELIDTIQNETNTVKLIREELK